MENTVRVTKAGKGLTQTKLIILIFISITKTNFIARFTQSVTVDLAGYYNDTAYIWSGVTCSIMSNCSINQPARLVHGILQTNSRVSSHSFIQGICNLGNQPICA